jgi:hypothetical protein
MPVTATIGEVGTRVRSRSFPDKILCFLSRQVRQLGHVVISAMDHDHVPTMEPCTLLRLTKSFGQLVISGKRVAKDAPVHVLTRDVGGCRENTRGIDVPTTAGPWKLVQSMSDMLVGDERSPTVEAPPTRAAGDPVTVVGDDGSDIAHVTPEPGKTDDVKLMGLAPELLEVVQGLMANDIETVGKSRERAAEILDDLKK